ncbi:hypothetical protein, partial [Pseudomonas sp. FW306-2-11AD]|uniref:hypothetical protein n=1 Tax=Pseudomonas sp. FW306-2-11AD TaxID=2070665 RepID=UPI001C47F32D
ELAPARLRSSRNLCHSVLQQNRIEWCWDRFALQREQAPSPQGCALRVGVVRIEIIQRPIYQQLAQYNHLLNRQRHMTPRTFQFEGRITGRTEVE